MMTVARTDDFSGVGSLPQRVDLLVEYSGSVSELSKTTGVSQSALRSWRAGQSDPGVEKLAALAAGTGARLQWLVTGEGDIFRRLHEDELKELQSQYEEYLAGSSASAHMAIIRFASQYASGKRVQRIPGILRFDLHQFSSWILHQDACLEAVGVRYAGLSESAVNSAYLQVEASLPFSDGFDAETKASLLVQLAKELTREELSENEQVGRLRGDA